VSLGPVEGSDGHYKVKVITWRLGEITIPVRVEENGNALKVSMECPVDKDSHEGISGAIHACSRALFLLAIYINDIENSAFVIKNGRSAYIGPVRLLAYRASPQAP